MCQTEIETGPLYLLVRNNNKLTFREKNPPIDFSVCLETWGQAKNFVSFFLSLHPLSAFSLPSKCNNVYGCIIKNDSLRPIEQIWGPSSSFSSSSLRPVFAIPVFAFSSSEAHSFQSSFEKKFFLHFL